MSRIGILIENDFEDSEYGGPVEGFKKDGHELVHVGLTAGAEVVGKHKASRVRIDKSITDVSVDDFDAVFIPGGYSPDQLRGHQEFVNFVRAYMQSGKPIFAICHAPQLLITADVLRGRKVTGWKSIIQDIKNAGAQYLDQAVVEDGNLISSRHPGDISAFTAAACGKLHALVQ